MTAYIVCQKKRNAPRMNVQVCQKKCSSKQECKEYLSYLKVLVKQNEVPLSPESTSLEMSAP